MQYVAWCNGAAAPRNWPGDPRKSRARAAATIHKSYFCIYDIHGVTETMYVASDKLKVREALIPIKQKLPPAKNEF